MQTHLLGYVAIILFQQLMIVGLCFGIVQLFHKRHHLRRLSRTLAERRFAELKLGRHDLETPRFRDSIAEPAAEVRQSPCLLTNLES